MRLEDVRTSIALMTDPEIYKIILPMRRLRTTPVTETKRTKTNRASAGAKRKGQAGPKRPPKKRAYNKEELALRMRNSNLSEDMIRQILGRI